MPALLRPANLYVLATYAALSAPPVVALLLGVPGSHPWQLAAISASAWLGLWALCRRPARFHALLLPAFLALPLELYLLVQYGQHLSTHHLGVILETSPSEAAEFIGGALWQLVLAVCVVLAWWASSWYCAWRSRELDWQGRWRLATLVILATGATLLAWRLPPPTAASKHRNAGLDMLARAWPFGLAARAIDFAHERAYLAELDARSSAFRFHARSGSDATEREVIVMVLGESSRHDRWSLNGYARPTNPELAREPNLVMLGDVITPVSATRLSVPVIISRKPAMMSLKDGFNEKSFVTAFKEAGFKTFWLSNQVAYGKFDTPVSVFAREADEVRFLNPGGTERPSYDEILLAPLAQALADPAPKVLIVLHTLGSHWNYAERYPASFDRWQPSLKDVAHPDYTQRALKPRIDNSYDNAILYTDWFLARTIGALKDTHANAALLYVADHGQTLYDNTCRIAFHGHNTQYEYHVPAFAWYSERYAARRPDKVAQLRRHRNAPLSTENMFHTLLDMADIRYPGEQLERSFVNSRWQRHVRYVESYGWTDYDDATVRGDCREIIARGKPLPRG